MKNLIKPLTNKMLNEIVGKAVKEATALQAQVNQEAAEQDILRKDNQPYSYMKAHDLEKGVHAVCEVLHTIFGGLPIYTIETIRKVTLENNQNGLIGYDGQDYVEMFTNAFEAR